MSTMNTQVQPISQLDQVGMVLDRPAVSLPPNAFSDALNVRFQDGTVRKMQGEVNIFPNLFDDSSNLIGGIAANFDGSQIKYIVFWPNPNIISNNIAYYLVIAEETRLISDNSIPGPGNTAPVQKRDVAYIVSVDGAIKVEKGVFSPAQEGQWHHTFFQGGFVLIINNTIDVPHYILDASGNTDINSVPDFLELPGWESYNINQILLGDTFNPQEDSYIFDLGQEINFDTTYIIVERVNSADTSTVVGLTPSGFVEGENGTANNIGYTPPNLSTIVTTPWDTADEYEIYYDTNTGTTVINLPDNLSLTGSDTVTVRVLSRNPVSVRAGILRSFGDFLVAGDLEERDINDNNVILRSLSGVVRTSDVAAPGSVPNNWNPFAAGVSTADEYVISETYPIRDMVEMQGNLYLYSTNSISVMRRTQNPSLPISISGITDSYGCQARNAVIEFEGKHLVVGSRDVYVFSGNPSGMQSVADDRVRRYLYSNMAPRVGSRLFLMDYKEREEIWICYPTVNSTDFTCDEALIWSYRNNTWTRRELRGVVAGTVGPIPGGGLPGSELALSGITGDKGVVRVGNQEVRILGWNLTQINSVQDFNDPSFDGTVYTGTGSTAIYGKSNGYFYNHGEDFAYPEITLTGPDSLSVTTKIYPVSGRGDMTRQELWDRFVALVEPLMVDSGWSMDPDNVPEGLREYPTDPVDYIYSVESTSLGLPKHRGYLEGLDYFDATCINAGEISSEGSNPSWATRFNASTGGLFDIVFTSSRNSNVVKAEYETYVLGNYTRYATPTICAIIIEDASFTGGEELLLIELGDEGTYDQETHTGINGAALNADRAKTEILNKISLSTNRIEAFDNGYGSLIVRTSLFEGNTSTLGEIRFNDNQTDADWIQAKYDATVANTIQLNEFSDVWTPNLQDESDIYRNPPYYFFNNPGDDIPLQVNSNSPLIQGELDTISGPYDDLYSGYEDTDPAYNTQRIPGRDFAGLGTAATFSYSLTSNQVYDVDRPWSVGTINPNREFPILASYKTLTSGSDQEPLNKILAADVGFSTPSYSLTPRVETADVPNLTYTITNNDAPLAYESYVERKQLNVSPDLDVERMKQFVLWASGNYTPYFGADALYNRLQVRIKATDNPGQDIDMSVVGLPNATYNNFFISESYKCDLRTTGRFLNLRITDKILDSDNNELTLTSNTKKTTATVFDQKALWEVSGLQPEFGKYGGRR